MANLRRSDREVVESPMAQGVDEEIAYTITTTNWGSNPSGVSAVVKNRTDDYTDVTATVMPDGSIGVSGDVITLKPLKNLTIDNTYVVEVKFTSGGNVLETFFVVNAER